MRWDRLFDDLDAQWTSEQTAEEAALAADESTHRRGRLTLAERLAELDDSGRAGVAEVGLSTRAGHRLRVEPQRIGAEWMTGHLRDAGREAAILLPLASVAEFRVPAATGGMASSAPSAPRVCSPSRAPITALYRELEHRRVVVRVLTALGEHRGRVVGVGRDHLDLALVDLDAVRPTGAVIVLPLGHLDHLRY